MARKLNKQTLQELWEKKVNEALAADRRQEQQQEAERVKPFVEDEVRRYTEERRKHHISPYSLTIRQFEAYEWLRWQIPQEIAAEKMGISQEAYSQMLSRLFNRYPELEPTKQAWLMRPDPIDPKKKARPKPGEAGSDEDRDTDESASTFKAAGHGYHTPGKSWWPDGRRRDGESIKSYAARTRRKQKSRKN